MGKADEIDKLDKAIKDAEIRIKSIQANVKQIDKEIAVLAPRKSELEHNIEFHKKSGTIPLAHEYKKSKDELTKIASRLAQITKDHKNSIEAYKHVETVLEKFRRDYYKLITPNDNNVLRVLFGGNRGKK